jgi:hypothetical protein
VADQPFVNQWLQDSARMARRLAKTYPWPGQLQVAIVDGRVVFRSGDSVHSLDLGCSSTARVLAHLEGFADNCGVGDLLLVPGTFVMDRDHQGRDQLVEVTRLILGTQNRWGEKGRSVHGRIHYKTRPAGRRRLLWFQPAKPRRS